MFIDTHAHLNFKGFKDDFDAVYKASLDANVGVIINVGSNYQTSLEAVREVDYSSTRMKSGGEDDESSRLRSNHKNHNLYAAVGVHPIHLAEDITETCLLDKKEYKVVTKQENFDYDKYLELAKNEGVVAIGETGLDYFHLVSCHPEPFGNTQGKLREARLPARQGSHSNRDSSATPQNDKIKNFKQIQKDVFREHIRLAKEMDLPLILHCRGSEKDPYDAYEEMIAIISDRPNAPENIPECHTKKISDYSNASEIIRESHSNDRLPRFARNDSRLRGVIHCFVGNEKQAQEFVDMGFYIGVNGIVTFKNSYELQDIIRELPLDKIVLETDCPFLAPDPYRGKRNEPRYIPIIAQKIAQLKNISLEEVEEQTTENAKELFKI